MIKSNITLIEQVETQEAETLLKKHKKIYLLWLIPPICFGIAILLASLAGSFLNYNQMMISSIFQILTLLSVIIVPIFCSKHLKPYKELLKVARENDRIRHIEKVKFLEKNRLYTQKVTQPLNRPNIQQTVNTYNQQQKQQEKK